MRGGSLGLLDMSTDGQSPVAHKLDINRLFITQTWELSLEVIVAGCFKDIKFG